MVKQTTDFLVIGGGIIGTAIAIELRRRHPTKRVVVLEKESIPGYHASGRNSGVLHAGFYYTADSLKAKFTAQGNRMLREYCKERGLSLNTCGKLVVAKNESELEALDTLLHRARANGVELHEISAREANEIEPRARTFERALWSPTTATVDPLEVLRSLQVDGAKAGISFLFNTAYRGRAGDVIQTNRGLIAYGHLVNAAGLYADRMARDFGFSQDYRILPFKGLYLYCSKGPPLRTHIYPVPNLKNPFLGVHHTLTVHGQAKIGPTAVPAFWREQYDGLSRFIWREFLEILKDEVVLLLGAGFDFRGLAIEEIKKYYRPHLVHEASLLADGVKQEHYTTWGKPGIRAQLLNIKTRKLEMDFRLEGDERSTHVLNAVSPAFTCSMPFAQYVCSAMCTPEKGISREGVGVE